VRGRVVLCVQQADQRVEAGQERLFGIWVVFCELEAFVKEARVLCDCDVDCGGWGEGGGEEVEH